MTTAAVGVFTSLRGEQFHTIRVQFLCDGTVNDGCVITSLGVSRRKVTVTEAGNPKEVEKDSRLQSKRCKRHF